MPEIDTLISFFIISVLLSLSPGPDILYVIAQSLAHGSRRGVQITLGLCTGLILHTVVVALGVAVVIKRTPVALSLIQYAGVGYLLYLAWHMWRDAIDKLKQAAANPPGGWIYYRRGVLMNLSNPKVLLFFLAFLPQFVQPEATSVAIQIIVLGLLFILAAILVFVGAAITAQMISQKIMALENQLNLINKITAVIFIILAVNLIFTDLGSF